MKKISLNFLFVIALFIIFCSHFVFATEGTRCANDYDCDYVEGACNTERCVSIAGSGVPAEEEKACRRVNVEYGTSCGIAPGLLTRDNSCYNSYICDGGGSCVGDSNSVVPRGQTKGACSGGNGDELGPCRQWACGDWGNCIQYPSTIDYNNLCKIEMAGTECGNGGKCSSWGNCIADLAPTTGPKPPYKLFVSSNTCKEPTISEQNWYSPIFGLSPYDLNNYCCGIPVCPTNYETYPRRGYVKRYGCVDIGTCDDLGGTPTSDAVTRCNNMGETNMQCCAVESGTSEPPPAGFCGNGIVEDGEECDVFLPPGLDCKEMGFDHGSVSCNMWDCTINTDNCDNDNDPLWPPNKGNCGDGHVERPNGDGQSEECDGSVSSGLTCASLGFDKGSVICTNCEIDSSGCISESRCGDGIVQNPNSDGLTEQCDGSVSAGVTCQTLGFDRGDLVCANCMIDVSGCEKKDNSESYCGDGSVQSPNTNGQNEQCDGSAPSCEELGFSSGSAYCSWNCMIDISNCVNNNPFLVSICGNGNQETGETCDDTNTVSGDGCSSTCQTECGNGKIDSVMEECDLGTRNGQAGSGCGADCKMNLNTNKKLGCAGAICSVFDKTAATKDCKIDKDCEGVPPNCGNGKVDSGEECDLGAGNSVDGSTGCDMNCDIHTITGKHLACEGLICKLFDLGKGGISCRSNYECEYNLCGNGKIDSAIEECDLGTARNGQPNTGCDINCKLVNIAGKHLACDSNYPSSCFLKSIVAGDVSCVSDEGCPYCGNERADSEYGETCDGNDLNGLKCENFAGYSGGRLECYAAGTSKECHFDFSGCTEYTPKDNSCGDGLVNDNEECEGNNLRGLNCLKLSSKFNGGTLACFISSSANGCKFDLSGCTRCGNNKAEPQSGETCDGSTNGLKCEDFGYTGGTLKCNLPDTSKECHFDFSGCTGYNPTENCGNGLATDNEECDGSDLKGMDKCTKLKLGYTGGDVKCLSNCLYDLSGCTTTEIVKSIDRVYWGKDDGSEYGPNEVVYVGDTVYMYVIVTGFNNEEINLELKEDDGLVGDDTINSNLKGNINNNKVKIPWTISHQDYLDAENEEEEEFYFIAKYPTLNNKESRNLKVKDREIPDVTIVGPEHRQMYFINQPLEFEAEIKDDDSIRSIEWFVDDEDDTVDLNGNNQQYTYNSGGQKTITLRVIDNEGNVAEDQIAILILASPGMLAYINDPDHLEVIQNNNFDVVYNASDSYVVKSEGSGCTRAITCLAGNCPPNTKNKPKDCGAGEIGLIGSLDKTFIDLLFNWTFDDKTTINIKDKVNGTKRYGFPSMRLNDKSIILNLSYQKDGIKLEEIFKRRFSLVGGSQCLGGTQVLYTNQNGMLIEIKDTSGNNDACKGLDGNVGTDDDCCPSERRKCTTGGCVFDENIIEKCGGYNSKVECEKDFFNVGRKRDSRNPTDPDWLALGCNNTEENGYAVSCGCVWKIKTLSGTIEECYLEKSLSGDDICNHGTTHTENEQFGDCNNGMWDYSYEEVYTPPASNECSGESKSETRTTKTGSLPCGKSYALGFFEARQIIVTIIIIVVLYLIYFLVKGRKHNNRIASAKSKKRR